MKLLLKVSTLTYNLGNFGFWMCSTGWFKQNCFRRKCWPNVRRPFPPADLSESKMWWCGDDSWIAANKITEILCQPHVWRDNVICKVGHFAIALRAYCIVYTNEKTWKSNKADEIISRVPQLTCIWMSVGRRNARTQSNLTLAASGAFKSSRTPQKIHF